MTKDYSHLASDELAAWLEAQGEDSWWTVDRDYFLSGKLRFPCSAVDFARFIRAYGHPFLIRHPEDSPDAKGQAATRSDITRQTFLAENGAREIMLAWDAQKAEPDWFILYEDLNLPEFVKRRQLSVAAHA